MVQCSGITRNGLRCSKIVKNGNYCPQHREKEKIESHDKEVLVVMLDQEEYHVDISEFDKNSKVSDLMRELSVKLERRNLKISNKDYFMASDPGNRGIMLDITFMTVDSFLSTYFHRHKSVWDHLVNGGPLVVESK